MTGARRADDVTRTMSKGCVFSRQRVMQGRGSRGGGGNCPPKLFISMGWICLCPPKFRQSLGISTFLPPPPKKKIVQGGVCACECLHPPPSPFRKSCIRACIRHQIRGSEGEQLEENERALSRYKRIAGGNNPLDVR